MFSMLNTIPLATYDYFSQSEYWDLKPNNFLEQQVNRFWQILVVLRSAFYKLINLRGKLKYLIMVVELLGGICHVNLAFS